jgi:GDP-L-fucose synthase
MSFWTCRRVLVTGGAGFVGSHVVNKLKEKGCAGIVVARKKDYDLTKEDQVKALFEGTKPDIVFHLAGLVGGILPNKERPAEFFYVNLMVGTLMLHYSWLHKVEKFTAAGAGCGYPENAPIPLKEESFWDGFPQKESAPYSLAKRLLHIQSVAYREQYGFNSIICIPGNIYGPYDNFNLLDAHVIPALVRKFVEAVEKKAPTLEVWGTGKPTRDFAYAGDVADGMIKATEAYHKSEIVNISSGVETSIQQVVEHLGDITGFSGEVIWNTSRPDGQPRRCFDVSKAKRELNFEASTDIRTGLESTVEWYRANMSNSELRK